MQPAPFALSPPGRLPQTLRTIAAKPKLAAAGILILSTNMLQSAQAAGCACAAAAFLLLLSGLPARYLIKRLLAVNLFFAFLWILVPLSFAPQAGSDGNALWFSVSPEAVQLVLRITLKGNAMAAFLLALAGSSSMPANAHALQALHLPKKLVALLVITYTNISLIYEEYTRIFEAAKLRGFVPHTGLASYKLYAGLIGLLLIRAHQRSRRVADAMLLRSFCGRFPLIVPGAAAPAVYGTILFACSLGLVAALLSFDFFYARTFYEQYTAAVLLP